MIYYFATLAIVLCASFSSAQELVGVPITIGQNTYEIRFDPAQEAVSAVATRFCIEQADSLGYTPQSPLTDDNLGNCANPVAEHLNNALVAERQRRLEAAGLLAVPVTIGTNTYEVRFKPAEEEVHAVARNFCIQQADSLGYTPQNPLTDDNLPNCVNPVADYLYAAAIKSRDDKLAAAGVLAVPVTVSGNTYEVRFKPAAESVGAVARNFCVSQADSLGYTPSSPLTDDNLPNCVNPVAEYLRVYAANVGVGTIA